MGEALLPDWDDRLPWRRTVGAITATEILRGSDETGLVVVVADAPGQPTKTNLRDLWRARSSRGVTPVLVAVRYRDDRELFVSLLGLDDDAVPVAKIEIPLAEQLIRDALNATSPSGLHAEVRRRLATLAGGPASGVRNEGLFASHVLEQQPDQGGWADLCSRAQRVVDQRGEKLLENLGFTIEAVPNGTVLRETNSEHRRAAAVLLSTGESFENPLTRFSNINAVTHGLAIARREDLDWLVVLGGPVIRLYPVNPDVGVGRKGETQTYVELDLSLLPSACYGYLPLLYDPVSFAKSGALSQLLKESSQYATRLSQRLRDRIYIDVVPHLAVAVANRLNVTEKLASEQKDALDEAYRQTMVILFRLLFVAYAEDRDLLPYGRSERYTQNALKTLAMKLSENPSQSFSATSTALWDGLIKVWTVIDNGDVNWGVPPYNGGLFTRDTTKSPSGAATYDFELSDDHIGPALLGLLVDMSAEGILGPVDFRSLSVREFGTIYEGLLESGLGIADTALTVDENETFLPAEPGDPIKVSEGEVYFHSRSGSRKATGSFFTKPFAVEHLLDAALEPSLGDHLHRVVDLLNTGATKTAAMALFDFRVIDLSMGSGHFLVAAVDRIEARFSTFLAENPLPEVAIELYSLRTSAAAQLNLDPVECGIDDGALLRRQIARRCIYGVDANDIAVELARLAVWIHTFIPGLPLSFLDHSLVWGNSLTGLGTMTEIEKALADAERVELRKQNASQTSALDNALEEFLERASQHLADLGTLSDANVGDVAIAAALQNNVEEMLAPLSDLCDLITAARATWYLQVGDEDRVRLVDAAGLFTAITADDIEAAVAQHPGLARARELVRTTLGAVHLPVRFPEVFHRPNPGFDCILGNPPWDKVRHEPQQFWVTVNPGLNALPDGGARDTAIDELRRSRPADAAREADEIAWRFVQRELFKRSFSLRGGTHIELAQLMLERAIRLTRPFGRLGLVLPRQFTVLAGWGRLREWLTQQYDLTVVQGRNHNEWIFEGIHASYAVVLLSAINSDEPHTLLSVASSPEDVAEWSADVSVSLSAEDIRDLSETCVLPWFGDPAEREVFDRMVGAPKLAGLNGWVRGRYDSRWDFTGTGADRGLATRTGGGNSWRVLMTAHVDAFDFDDGVRYRQYVHDLDALTAKDKGVGRDDEGQVVLDRSHPLIVIRRPSRSDDSRTLIATALPEAGFLHNAGYVHAVSTATDCSSLQVLALLGYLNTFVADWWARRFVDRHVTAPVVNQLALPDWDEAQIVDAANITSSLLARGGSSRLAGGVEVADKTPEISSEDLLARLNRLALDGFSLDKTALEIILEDFNTRGIPARLRDCVIATFALTRSAPVDRGADA